MALDIYYTKERHTGRWIFMLVLIGLLAATGWFGYRWYSTGETPFSIPIASANTGTDESDVTSSQLKAYSVSGNNPRYVRIPTLDLIDTRVYPVKLDASNQIATPSNINDTSWYEKSATPGSGGVILMSGHTVGANRDGSFAQLKTLSKGAQIVIERGDGRIFTYGVVENESMAIAEVNATGMASMGKPVKAGQEGLNIIVADGKWVPRLGTFDHRVLLRASLLDD